MALNNSKVVKVEVLLELLRFFREIILKINIFDLKVKCSLRKKGIDRVKILHLQSMDKFIEPYINLINKYFKPEDHSFAVLTPSKEKEFNSVHKNINYIYKKLPSLLSLIKLMYKSERILLHGLFNKKIIILLFLQPWLLKKCNWIVWGGDLYCYSNKRDKIKDKLIEMMRRKIIRNLRNITTLVKGDYNLAVKWYGTNAKYNHGVYVNPINLHYLDSMPHLNKTDMDILNIQVGNSGNPSNQHIEVLKSLKKFRKENIKIYLPLSYGGSEEYIKEVIEFGYKVFGGNFVPLLKFLKADEYAKYLSSIDIAIFNHNRQQGLGNIFALVYLRKKVFVRSDITSWDYLTESLDLDVFKTEEIDQFSYEEFIKNISTVDNPQKVKKLFEDKYIAQIWNKVFEAENK
ncbi:TDP-N-acetylfucosamine:lipid II N-acetylfucosaminyltransferase [Metabacillus litoralis]|uniref:TDP-N-acetylfucosamine:lipid II N-acetylfucosaminyltransferase n=1 Tax=Metabacillus litoralis TaxID=152268 RepID=UPI001CFEA013|nr:TDP-N-acetylfucosamine:lipid II N-acetylfucosaminyltransferase [Metabacillus litoralis]